MRRDFRAAATRRMRLACLTPAVSTFSGKRVYLSRTRTKWDCVREWDGARSVLGSLTLLKPCSLKTIFLEDFHFPLRPKGRKRNFFNHFVAILLSLEMMRVEEKNLHTSCCPHSLPRADTVIYRKNLNWIIQLMVCVILSSASFMIVLTILRHDGKIVIATTKAC